MRRELCIVIAAYGEATSIADVVAGLLPHAGLVVVVDDGSGDETSRCAREAGATVLRHAVNRGQGAALQTGITYGLRAGARYLVTFDADGQHDPADLPALLAPIVSGEADVCLGSRFLGGSRHVPVLRRLTLRLAVLFTRLTSGLPVTDAHNGLRAFSRRAAERIHITLDRMAHASEMMDQIRTMKLPYREVPVHIRYTAYSIAKGQSSTAAVRIAIEYLFGRVFR